MSRTAEGLTTPRLALRRIVPDDLDLLDRLNGDPDVMHHMGGPMTRAQTETFLIERILGYYDGHPGLGIWMTLERDGGAPIGLHLLNHIQGEAHIQVGYRLFKQHWGRGYATEMTTALLHYGFVELGLPRIVAITQLSNFASQRVLEKSGLMRDGERSFPHPAYAASGPLAWYERERAAWLAQRPRVAAT